MSGTSVDAIDLALVRFRPDTDDPSLLHGELLATGETAWDPGIRRDMLQMLPPRRSGVAEWNRLHAAVGEGLGRAAAGFLAHHGARPGLDVQLVVSHGQTLHHWVREDGTVGGSLQIGDPHRIHAATGVPVLSDLRSADIAAGGQGAPLAPLLDSLLFGDCPTAALNLGGISNITIVGVAGGITGGDVGPANALMDAAVAEATTGRDTCDVDGRLAARGRIHDDLLQALLADPFYRRPFPRSTGREYFTGDYVAQRAGALADVDLPDLLATLVELTARTVRDAVSAYPVERVVGSGGGMRNPVLRARLAQLLGERGITLRDASDLGVPADAKEAVLMAVIGWCTAHGLPGVLPGADGTGALTGARSTQILGSLTPARPPAAWPVSRTPLMPRRLVLTGGA
ncbi:anhydro-N-acetylmuramic acid kinase [Brachybacterium sp. EF45031]|nr:anhydro-N-acetylmuramic acid kinase [Brachybacterium sillae]